MVALRDHTTPATSDFSAPPQNPEAEDWVLGAIVSSPSAVAAVVELLQPSDFYKPSNGTIFKAAVDLYARGEPVDALTLADHLDKSGELDAVGGRIRFHELAAIVPATANVAHWARIVREMATLRRLIETGQKIARLGWGRDGARSGEHTA